MKVGNVSPGKGADRAKRKKGVSGGGGASFADQLRGASPDADVAASESGVVDPAALDGVDALLAMQEVGDAPDGEQRRKAANYGEALLDKLKGLQDALLLGAIEKEELMELAHKVRAGRARVQDPRLNAILDEIELRAEVEIAKFTRGF